MRDVSILFRRAALGQVGFLVWSVAFFGVDPLQVTVLPLQILLLLAAAFLLVGSFPGMIIAKALAEVGERGARRLIIVFATALPLGVMLLGAGLVLDSDHIHAVEQDPSSLWRLVLEAGMVIIQGVSLIVNLATLAMPRKPGPQGFGA
jgi:hypothetical protein